MPLPPLRKPFDFTVVLALRKALKTVRLRREVTDGQIKTMARIVVDKILPMNWKIRQGRHQLAAEAAVWSLSAMRK
jgi:hypothetical protein